MRAPIVLALGAAATSACLLVDPFEDLAIDRDVASTPVDATASDAADASREDAAIDAGTDAAPETTGKLRWVTLVDQAIATTTPVIWGDVQQHPAGGVVVLSSFQNTTAGKTSAGGKDLAVMRIDDAGKLSWLERLGAEGDEYGHTLAVDAQGNIWISGSSSSDPSFGSSAPNPNHVLRPFVAKLDANGALVRPVPLDPGGVGDGSCHGLTVAKNGDVFAACRFEGTIAFTGADDAPVSYASSGSPSDVLYLRLDPVTAKPIWSVVYGGNGSELVWDLACSASGDLRSAGTFESTILTPTGRARVGSNTNGFVVELDGPTGLPSWVRTWGVPSSNGLARALAIADGPNGELVVGGDFRGTFDFGAFGKATATSRSAWIAALDAENAGLETSLAVVIGASSSSIRGMAIDSASHVVSAGDLSATTPPSIGASLLGFSSTGYSGFVVKTTLTGDVLWAKSWVAGAGGMAFPRRVSIGTNREITVIGTFSGTLDFGDGVVRTAAGGGSIFVARLDP